jgi:hypothetical protein
VGERLGRRAVTHVGPRLSLSVYIDRRTEHFMKYLALAAAGVVLAGLAACSHAAAPTAMSASHRAVTAPVSCSQQYAVWEHGNGKGLIAALNAVSAASTVGDAQVLTTELEKARPTVAKATRYPVPACADPRNYWSVLLMHMTAATASNSTAASVQAAMKDVPKIAQELTAELNTISE